MQAAERAGNGSEVAGEPRRSRLAFPAAAGLVLATPVAAWWLTGERLGPARTDDPPVPAVPVPAGTARTAGVAASVLGLACLVLVVRAFWRRRFDRRWAPSVVLLVLAGAVLGAGWRSLSSGTTGAGRGTALALLAGLPLVVALVGAAAVAGLVRHPRNPGRRRRRGRRRWRR